MNYNLLELLYMAYYDARRCKRSAINHLRFEIGLEENLLQLYNEIESRSYLPKRSVCFILKELNLKREIFAADFSDSVVHRLLYNQIAPLFESRFIADSYSCRKGKGTHFAVQRLDHHVRSCSQNFKRKCYVLKLDIQGYFFAIDKLFLYEHIKSVLNLKWRSYCSQQLSSKYMLDLDTIFFLLERIIFHDPTKNCIIHGSYEDWLGFPQNKSLFHALPGHGLPIGNLTSQLFSNIYMNIFDQWVKRTLHIRHYGRYVDDFYIVHEDKEYLRSLIPILRTFLKDKLSLTLHPKKIYLQPIDNGVQFVGGYVKPYRIYPGRRVVKRVNGSLMNKCNTCNRYKLRASLNSYLGTIKHYKSYNVRRKIILEHSWIFNYGWINAKYTKFTPIKYNYCRL